MLALASACKDPDPEVVKAGEIARRSNLIVRADLAARTLAELEQLVAIPLERALAGVPHVTAIDTTIRGAQVEILLVVAVGTDARVIERDVKLRLLTAVVPPATQTTTVLASTWSGAIRLTTSEERPDAFDAPRLSRVRTCGPDIVREVAIDPVKLAAHGLAIDDVLAALASSSAEAALLPGEVRIDAVATIGDTDRSPCRVVGDRYRHVASIHAENADFSKTLGPIMSAGWSLLPMLGDQHELVIGFDGFEGAAHEAIARVVSTLQAQHGIEIGFAMEERGPPRVGRIVFRPNWDAKVRDAANAAVAAVPGVRLLELVETGLGSSEQAVAIFTGEDRDELIARARAALPVLAEIDPQGGMGCTGCDQRVVLELRAGEATSDNTARIARLVGDGLDIASSAGPVRVRIAAGAELAPEAIAGLLVRTSSGATAPLSTVAEIATVERPSVLLRRDGTPAVRLWKRPRNSTGAGLRIDIAKMFPGVTVILEYPELW
ncbi:MAG: hypothetical protein ACKV2T_25980 [Kofleriaceae bacterium]